MAKSQEPRAKSQEEKKGERTGVAILIIDVCLFIDFVLAQAADDTSALIMVGQDLQPGLQDSRTPGGPGARRISDIS